jgi:hypothetical protein
MSLEIDASPNDVEAMVATMVVDFEPGDTLGKLMAFVNQVHMSSEIILLKLGTFRISRSLRSVYGFVHGGVVFHIVLK